MSDAASRARMPTRMANATPRRFVQDALSKTLWMTFRDPKFPECAERGEESTMALHIRDPEADRLVRMLAERKGIALTDAIKLAVGNELRRDAEKLSLRERIRPIQERIASYPPTGLEADKAFYDEISGDA
ncbi:type II toxin-antitoxin system VapB family antitoxin [Methylobacterium sp.]|uniref:type II toxin-antitoxin system VapB family antitoxin n=1 Tax=Methylobacterium sp. TaxID=409 RepID=UPI0025E21C91|nr:type II toxin-antitoxin system VapB family antitoxin [Methylobacterium sp.]